MWVDIYLMKKKRKEKKRKSLWGKTTSGWVGHIPISIHIPVHTSKPHLGAQRKPRETGGSYSFLPAFRDYIPETFLSSAQAHFLPWSLPLPVSELSYLMGPQAVLALMGAH